MKPIDIIWIIGLLVIIYFTFIKKDSFEQKDNSDSVKKSKSKLSYDYHSMNDLVFKIFYFPLASRYSLSALKISSIIHSGLG